MNSHYFILDAITIIVCVSVRNCNIIIVIFIELLIFMKLWLWFTFFLKQVTLLNVNNLYKIINCYYWFGSNNYNYCRQNVFFVTFYFIFKNRRAIEYDWFKIWKKIQVC